MSERATFRFRFRYLLAILFICGVAYYFIKIGSLDRLIAAEEKKLIALGMPLRASDFPRAASVTDNAASIYHEAFRLQRGLGLKEPRIPQHSKLKENDPNYLVERAAYLQALKPVMDLVAQAAQRENCAFERNWQAGYAVIFPEFTDLKNLAKIAAEMSTNAAKKGDFKESFRWLETGRKMGEHAQEPTLIACLVSIATDAIVHRELQRQTASHYRNPEFLRRARAFLDNPTRIPIPIEALKGEVFMAKRGVEQIASGALDMGYMGGDSTEMRAAAAAMKIPTVRKQVQFNLLSRYRAAIENMAKDPNDAMALSREFRIIDEWAMKESAKHKYSPSTIITGVMMPVFAQAGEAFIKMEATRRITRQGLELFAAKGATGSFPVAIKMPPKQWGVDPFNGHPLIYKPKRNAFFLYSVGGNLTDDGGYVSDSNYKDIMFYFPRGTFPPPGAKAQAVK